MTNKTNFIIGIEDSIYKDLLSLVRKKAMKIVEIICFYSLLSDIHFISEPSGASPSLLREMLQQRKNR